MDEIVKKIAGLGFPGVILVILVAAGGSYATVISTLTALGGPLGFIGGLGVLGLLTMVGDALAGYGIETLLKNIYAERSKTESVRYLLKEIKDLPISHELKLKLKHQLNPETVSNFQGVQPPRTVEIIEE
ncbi:hypothetical protein [Iningainema tapete]|uniref:Uncharacterized protein n=1 Tax=Iningainema tapete BLCC-T55 TaxID=2748662 RepID=A0A8J7BZS0_9CYAN|nr:hypothetical protein [Iningainema tapete]MBD2776538.1 hypothetical protein [Iningainema tapete BLCC-T55]